MEMTQTNSNWNSRPSVRKGDFAEAIVRSYLEEKGFVVYEPITNGPHCFDKLAVRDKKQFIIVECKAKAKRTYYDDTGINLLHYQEYKYAAQKHKIPVFIFFIDEHLAEIYGNFISVLEEKENGYPLIDRNIIYFPMSKMRRGIAALTPEQVDYLKQHSRRNYGYG